MLASAARSTADGEQPDDGLSEPFSQARLDRAVNDPTTAVFVNITADWCVTCLVNEQVALSGERFTQTLKDHNVLYLKGDWTRRDETITDYLARFERNGVPLYVAYPRNGDPPIVLPQVLTPKGVSRVLESL
jgi:thiol:disulfide interchange protein DsbD